MMSAVRKHNDQNGPQVDALTVDSLWGSLLSKPHVRQGSCVVVVEWDSYACARKLCLSGSP